MQTSTNKINEKKNRFYFNRGIEFVIKDPLPKGIDMEKIMGLLRSNLPEDCFKGINHVYFGQFKILKTRKISALHHEGSIYIDNEQPEEKDFLDDLVHEFAHRFEDNNAEGIYKDGEIVNEFLGKRNRLYNLLVHEVDFELNYFDFLNTEFTQEFDSILYKKIGYTLIRNVAPTLFVRPYAATSVREYFATGFEAYFLEGEHSIKNISPALYKKLKTTDGFNDFTPKD
tara:strand:+ start:275 stop:958 length:684 start_codon:yes stop_codon:yes gene_type:complete